MRSCFRTLFVFTSVSLALPLFVSDAAHARSQGPAPFGTQAPSAPRLLFPHDPVPPTARTPERAARELLKRHADALTLDEALIDRLVLERTHDVGRGAIIVTFKHEAKGLPVWHDALKVMLERGTLKLLAVSGQIHPVVPTEPRFTLSAEDAVAAALFEIAPQVSTTAADVVIGDDVDGGGYARVAQLDDPAVAMKHVRVKRVLAPVGDLTVEAYAIELSVVSTIDGEWLARFVVVAADDGRVLWSRNLMNHAEFQYRVWADATGEKRPLDSPLGDTSPHPTGAPGAPLPAFVPPTLVTIDGFNSFQDPWLADDAIETTGNNVDAYTDDDEPAGFSQGDLRGTVTAPGVFDHVVDPTAAPLANDTQRNGAVVALFYVTNWLHDYWYDSGFDEEAGNAQQSNFGRGGVEGDVFNATAQLAAAANDPFRRNNAFMATFEDGEAPFMGMFVWDGASEVTLTDGVDDFAFGIAGFGPAEYDVTGETAIVDDRTAPVTDACEDVFNAAEIDGKIAIIDRGTCTFHSKTVRAEAAGAIGVIIVNNNPDPPIGMAADDTQPDPRIPAMMMTQADGAALKAAVAGGAVVTMTMRLAPGTDIDGALDAQVAAHEWGHYFHLRQVLCESLQCFGMSEGWGDFISQITLMRSTDDLDGVYPNGVFDISGVLPDALYDGIRRYPYSTDPGVNPLTFGHIAASATLPATPEPAFEGSNTEVHSAGEVWAQMMWDAYRSMLTRTEGANPDYTFDEAQRRLADYIVGGMQLAPDSPTYLEQRDAILAAANAADPADALLLAQGFGLRGAGTCAIGPERQSFDLEGITEGFTAEGNLAIEGFEISDATTTCDSDGILDGGEQGVLTLNLRNASILPIAAATIQVLSTSTGVTIGDTSLDVGALAPFETRVITAPISLALGSPDVRRITITARVTQGATCLPTGLQLRPTTNADDVATGLTLDSVDSEVTVWTTEGDVADLVWAKKDAGGNGFWAGLDADAPSDTALVSPPLQVSATEAFRFTAKHRHEFESCELLPPGLCGPTDGPHFDGGVIEVSTDDGVTWLDVTEAGGTANYNGVIGDFALNATNVLFDRDGYVARNASFPVQDLIDVDFGTALAGETVRIRFRIGTDEAVGEAGWEIDDIEFFGIDNAPFSGLVNNVVVCAEGEGEGEGEEGEGEGEGEEGEGEEGEGEEGEGEGEDVKEDPAGCTCASTSPSQAILVFALLGLLRFARRRSGA